MDKVGMLKRPKVAIIIILDICQVPYTMNNSFL